jgi:hypothetical protein
MVSNGVVAFVISLCASGKGAVSRPALRLAMRRAGGVIIAVN